MKKITWIIALLLALALIFVGCPGEGDPDDGDEGEDEDDVELPTEGFIWETFSATGAKQDKAKVTGTENSVTFAYNNNQEIWGELVTPESARWDASDYTGIKFGYKTPLNLTIFAQDTDSIFIFAPDDSDGWGAISFADDWTEISLPFSILQRQDWFGTANHEFDASAIIKFAFQIGSGASSGDKIEIRNFAGYTE